MALTFTEVFVILASFSIGSAHSCEVYARTGAGAVCGTRRVDARGQPYASFRGVPYAQQPVGRSRFKPLQPLEAWSGVYNASKQGPMCPQSDILFRRATRVRPVSEACIYANIHVPLAALPQLNNTKTEIKANALPVLVFIHGGGFAFGSGDVEFNGPERLVSEGLIVITFNFRLNIFGFLSLNTSEIAGNNGLRDIVHLLRWVKDNAQFFGGNPHDVTLAGQSSGATAAHILSMSPAAKGLFKRLILMSGTAIPTYYTTSPNYARFLADSLLNALGINRTTTSSTEIHRRLVETPLETLMDINEKLLDVAGVSTFLPVIESSFEGVEQIIDIDTETAIASGRGSDFPMVIGFTNVECETFRRRYEELDITSRLRANHLEAYPVHLNFTQPLSVRENNVEVLRQKYYQGGETVDSFLKQCTELFFQYPALKLAEYRKNMSNAAPTYLYEFAYNADVSILKTALNLSYDGAAHLEDLSYVFQINAFDVQQSATDQKMNLTMNAVVRNFIYNGEPSYQKECMPAGVNSWKAVSQSALQYQYIDSPCSYKNRDITQSQKDILNFYEVLEKTNGGN